MSLDLFQQEANDRLTALPPVQNVDPGMWDGFIRGTGMVTMREVAKVARAADLAGSLVPIIADTFTGGTEAQDKYFAGHDAIFGRAVDYWTTKPQEVGMAGQVMGSLLAVLPQVIISPPLAVATTQLGTAEDLANVGVTTGKAQAVGAVQALTLGTGIWMPILGANLWQRAVIGGAGFNLVQGTAARAVSGAILADTPAKDMFKAFDAEAMTLDVLMGLAFGGLVHLSPTQRAQGAAAWDKIESWAKNLNPSDKAAIATLREAQHLNVDSTPGKPVGTPDIEAHVERMRAAIDQLATDQPVNVEDITIPRRTADIAEAPPQVRELLEQEQQLRQEWNEAENSRGNAMERGDQEAIALWDKEMQRIAGDLEDVITRRADLWQPEEVDTQPRFEPDPARTAQADATARDLQAAAETVRAEEGIPPPPQEPPRVVQSVRRTIEEELARAGRPAEEAAAGAAIWDAFYTTMAKRIGTTVEDLWSRFPLARITNEMPGGQALKQGPGGEQVITVGGKDRPITNADGRRIAADIEELQAFWNWFKDSKVVDADGKPLVVYHGTNDKFSTFDSSQIGKSSYDEGIIGAGFYFSDNKDYAETYGAPIEVYLSLQNPLVITHSNINDVLALTGGKDLWPNGNASLYKRLEYAIAGKGKLFTKKVMDAGHDGIVFRDAYETKEGLSSEYIAFRPEQIKSAIGNRGTFDPKNPNILYQDKRNTWYKSALGEAITNLNMKQGDAKAWLQALKGLGSKGVKAEEVKWSGIEEWLQLQEGKITKEQVQEFLANNGVKVEEVMLGGSGLDENGGLYVGRYGDNEWAIYRLDDGDSADPVGGTYNSEQSAASGLASMQEAKPTKYGNPDLVLPGGENYRELLLTLPTKSSTTLPEGFKVVKGRSTQGEGMWSLVGPNSRSGDMLPLRPGATEADAIEVAVHILTLRGAMEGPATFRSSHFDQPNILAHVRFNERTDAEGKKVLFIEEFQSDWAQKGKREGFDNENAFQSLIKERDQLGDSQQDVARYNQITEELGRMQRTMGKGVPAAPFVGKTDAWVALALKRMIAYAAENGFDRVAWTRGEQQVERYTGALRKAVDVIEWTKTDKGVQLVGYKGTADNRQMAEMRTAVRQIDDEINALLGNRSVAELTQAEQQHLDNMQARRDDLVFRLKPLKKVVDTTEKEDALSDAIGKAMAEKIISDPNQSGTIEGENIRIDSTGMAGFYDRIVPKVANEVLKKLGGGKVGETKISNDPRYVLKFEDGPYRGETYLSESTGDSLFFNRPEHAEEFARLNNMPPMAIVKEAREVPQQSFDITPKMKDAVSGGLPLFQKTKGTERGYMSIGDEGRVIGLLEGADASTFIHESGHFFLDTMAEIGKLPDVPAAVRADLDTALTWMGLKDPAKWVDMTLDEKRPYHEKFARGFEQYLREGKAPSEELKGVFQRFRDWLVELYKSAKSLNVKLNDDIRGVLNRMLADQTRNPSTEAPPAPSVRPGSPPPPGVDGEAQAGAEAQMRAMLQDMALNETGWAQEGGKLLDRNELGTGKPSFTTWIPKAEWWPGRPDKKLNAAKVQEAVRKYLAGEKLKPGEQRTVDYMIDIANARNKGIDTVGGMEEYKALAEEAWDEGLDPTTENVVDLDLVARAAAIDEAYVERAALKYENDDAAFRGELEMLIYETERAQATEAAGRSKAGEQKTKPGQPGEAQKPTDIVRAEADLIVEKNPDMPITVGVNPDGTPMTMTAREFLDQARAEAELNRADIPLLEVAAQCLLGVS